MTNRGSCLIFRLQLIFTLCVVATLAAVVTFHMRQVRDADAGLGEPVSAHRPLRTPRSHMRDDSNRRPTVWIHLGPHKSATTTVQCAMDAHGHLLTRDRIRFLGKVDWKHCANGSGSTSIAQRKSDYDQRFVKLDKCLFGELQHKSGDTPSQCREDVAGILGEHRRNGTSLVLSKEGLSDVLVSPRRQQFWTVFHSSILEGWNVVYLLTYRRYFEWLPSAYYQHEYHTRVQLNEPWSDAPLPTVWDAIRSAIRNKDENAPSNVTHKPYPYVDDIRTALMENMRHTPSSTDANTRIVIVNMHSYDSDRNNDIVAKFFCSVLSAPIACRYHTTVPPKRISPAFSVLADRINHEAIRLGLWRKTAFEGESKNVRVDRPGRRRQGRYAAMQRTARFLQSTSNGDASPISLDDRDNLICPSTAELDLLLSISLWKERQILGDTSSTVLAARAAEHEQAFDRYVGANRYCTINASKILHSNLPMWKDHYSGWDR